MTVYLQAQSGVSFSTDLPGSGSVANIVATDTTYVISGTSSGSVFTVVQINLPARWVLRGLSVLNVMWNDSGSGGVGIATWTVEYSKDNGATWPQWCQFSTSGFGAQTFGTFTGTDIVTNVRVRMTGFGANGQAWIDELRLSGDKGDAEAAITLGALTGSAAGTVEVMGAGAEALAPLAATASGTVLVAGQAVIAVPAVVLAADDHPEGQEAAAALDLPPILLSAHLFKWEPAPSDPTLWSPTPATPQTWSAV